MDIRHDRTSPRATGSRSWCGSRHLHRSPGPGRDVTATDLSPRCVKELEERFDHRTDVTVLHCDLVGSREAGPFDSAVLVNVLEHIEDDTGALKELAAQLVMGGRLALWVPAHMQLY